ncbi:hypothetical protein WJX73_006464 [Symbiochloris irregularis]|uniref:Inositol hexakisphosphate and diphosphoinositol-pentakisphosphate kinase n=1 Tax=Symbiochloris irregularis TaxID=706552 RepID=A0AAW1NYR8_9CHLO
MSESTSSPRTPSTFPNPFGNPDSGLDLPNFEDDGAHHEVTAQRSMSTTVALRRRQYIKRNEDARQARNGGLRRLQEENTNGMKRARSEPGLLEDDLALPRIRMGICAMDRKARSKPMRAILDRLHAFGEFDIVVFGDKTILDDPISEWPRCDCLLSWHSEGFPLAKAQKYAALRKPYLINDMQLQDLLLDRRRVYQTLQDSGIPVPNHIKINREGLRPDEDPPGFVETEDYVELDGVKICKPFVEKPSDGDDHNIYIYYPHSMGGGVKRLYRKVESKSGDYDPTHPGSVRRDGSYIIEEFLTTGGTDVKVYTVGPRYAHAEARKSPVVDGKVTRSADGKELRFPVLLSPQEKEIARMVCLAFGQKVCGFDLLRSERGTSFVCDVNGWSFVKNSHKYYDDAAGILRSIVLSAIAPHRLATAPPDLSTNSGTPTGHMQQPSFDGHLDVHDGDQEEHSPDGTELRCVLTVVRHGDRTPKQKMKMTVTQEPLLELMHRHLDAKGKQAKLKSPQELQDLLDVTRELLAGMEQRPQGLKPSGSALQHAKSVDKPANQKDPRGLNRSMTHAGGDKTKEDRPAGDQRKANSDSGTPTAAKRASGEFIPAQDKDRVSQAVEEGSTERDKGAEKSKDKDMGKGKDKDTDKAEDKEKDKEQEAATDALAKELVNKASLKTKKPSAVSVARTDTDLEAEGARSRKEGTSSKPGSQGGTPTKGKVNASRSLDAALMKGLQRKLSARSDGSEFETRTSAAEATAPATATANATDKGIGKPPSGKAADSEMEEIREKFRIVKTVLEQGGQFAGINRKVQLKPVRWSTPPEGSDEAPRIIEALLILKHGGVLTHAGREQAEVMGREFRNVMYPRYGPAGGGLLRLHSTYRHDLKINSSDEGRVQTSAAAFTQGLLDLEGTSLTPILVSLVKKDAGMLDAFGKGASEDIQAAKKELYKQMTWDPANQSFALNDNSTPLPSPPPSPKQPPLGRSASDAAASLPTSPPPQGGLQKLSPAASLRRSEDSTLPYYHLRDQKNPITIHPMPEHPLELLRKLVDHIQVVVEQLRQKCLQEGRGEVGARGYSALTQAPTEWVLEPGKPCGGERLLLMFDRWRKLLKAFYSEKKKQFDISKVPDIYDSAKYDAIHNSELDLEIEPLYRTAKQAADAVIPNEYGIDPQGKLRIGSKICCNLLGKVLADLANMREESLATAGMDASSEPLSPFASYVSDQEKEKQRVASGVAAGAPTPPKAIPAAKEGKPPKAPNDSGSADAGSSSTLADTPTSGGVMGAEEVASTTGADDDTDRGSMHRLCPTYAQDINSPLRHVRTRIYFTSESHVHSLVNVLRFSHLDPDTGTAKGEGLLSEEAMQMLHDATELDYLTHIVFRMYENTRVAVTSPERFRVEVLFSSGAYHNPYGNGSKTGHFLPVSVRSPLHRGVGASLQDIERLLAPFSQRPSLATTTNNHTVSMA